MPLEISFTAFERVTNLRASAQDCAATWRVLQIYLCEEFHREGEPAVIGGCGTITGGKVARIHERGGT
jgi:hypothetical protein